MWCVLLSGSNLTSELSSGSLWSTRAAMVVWGGSEEGGGRREEGGRRDGGREEGGREGGKEGARE